MKACTERRVEFFVRFWCVCGGGGEVGGLAPELHQKFHYLPKNSNKIKKIPQN